MLLTLRSQYSTTSPRAAADAVITALTPAAWYRNATGVTASGGFASQWDDYSGNGRHLVQATGTNQPAYNSTGGVFTFDGADNYMKATAFTLNQPETIYLVVNQISWASAEIFVDGNSVNSMLIRQTSSGASPEIQLFAGGFVGSNTNLTVGSYGIVCGVFNGASSVLRVNDTADVTGNCGASNGGGLTMGARPDAGGGFCNMAVKECVVFASAHDDTTRDSVITALNNALTVF